MYNNRRANNTNNDNNMQDSRARIIPCNLKGNIEKTTHNLRAESASITDIESINSYSEFNPR